MTHDPELVDSMARVIAAAIWRPQPHMSGDIWKRLGPLRQRDAMQAAEEVLLELEVRRLIRIEPAGRE